MLVSRGAKRLISSTAEDFYKLSAIALNGEQVNFSKYKGKVVLIQNTASL
jgi:glutathione peroxidase-family protein